LNVTTGKIADEATCIYNTAQTAAATDWIAGWGGTPTTIQSITETSLGGVVNVFYSFTVHNYDASNHHIYYKLYRGATELTGWIASGTIVTGTDIIISGSFVDVPGSGSVTYYIKALDQNTGTPEDHKATYRNMVFSESKGK
jgi:hypothetical protein